MLAFDAFKLGACLAILLFDVAEKKVKSPVVASSRGLI